MECIMIKEIDLKTGKVVEREYTQEEIAKRDAGISETTKISKRDDILAQLAEIDLKSIRAIREGDTNRIQALELEASELRKKL